MKSWYCTAAEVLDMLERKGIEIVLKFKKKKGGNHVEYLVISPKLVAPFMTSLI